MKKGTKIVLWTAVGCILIGGVLTVIGSAAGGQKQLPLLTDHSGSYNGEKETAGQEVLSGDFERTFPADQLKDLKLLVGVHALTMEEADVEEVTIEGSNCEKIQCYTDNGTLVLKDVGRKTASVHSTDRSITVTVPKGLYWQSVDIDAPMASVCADSLETEKAELEAGMGSIEIRNLIADEVTIEAAMGSIAVEDFVIRDLDISGEMGSVEMEGSLSGSLEAEANMGSVSVALTQKEADFNYEIRASMGSVIVGDSSYSGLDQEKIINNQADSRMELEAAMGSIEIYFK